MCDVCINEHSGNVRLETRQSITEGIRQLLSDGEWHKIQELNQLNVNRKKLDIVLEEMVDEEELEVEGGMIKLKMKNEK